MSRAFVGSPDRLVYKIFQTSDSSVKIIFLIIATVTVGARPEKKTA